MKANIRIVLMDDQVLILEAISALLGAHGVEHGIKVVACTENYSQVLQTVQQHQPHLVLLDMHMPEINGSVVAYKLKRYVPGLKIIMLSSFDSMQDLALAKDAGAHGYAFKSDSIDVLMAIIRKVMKGKESFVSSVSQEKLTSAAIGYVNLRCLVI